MENVQLIFLSISFTGYFVGMTITTFLWYITETVPIDIDSPLLLGFFGGCLGLFLPFYIIVIVGLSPYLIYLILKK